VVEARGLDVKLRQYAGANQQREEECHGLPRLGSGDDRIGGERQGSLGKFAEHGGALALVMPSLQRICFAMVREQVIRKRLKFRANVVCLVAEKPLDGDRPPTLGAEAVFAHFFDRAAAGARHRDRRAGAVCADLLGVHEPGEEHLATAFRAGLRGTHCVVAAGTDAPSIEVGCNPAGFSAEPAGFDRSGVAGQADELGTTDNDGRALTAP